MVILGIVALVALLCRSVKFGENVELVHSHIMAGICAACCILVIVAGLLLDYIYALYRNLVYGDRFDSFPSQR